MYYTVTEEDSLRREIRISRSKNNTTYYRERENWITLYYRIQRDGGGEAGTLTIEMADVIGDRRP